jgi:hypothetical protein
VCDARAKKTDTSDPEFMRIQLIRQGTDLGRISDDLTGAVPGGNFTVDSGLAKRDIDDLKKLVDESNLCPPLKGKLSAAVQDLVDADATLVGTGGGPGAAGALQDSQARYQALVDLTNNPPSA